MCAQAACGDIYGYGQGVAKNYPLAFVYYEKAAVQGHSVAQNKVGVAYWKGEGCGCEQSYEKAADWFEKLLVRATQTPWPPLGHSTPEARVFLKISSVRLSFARRAAPWGTQALS